MKGFQKFLLLGMNQKACLHEAAPLSLNHATAIIENMLGQYRLMASIMLNCGLHPRECVNLRIRHFCRDKHQLIVPNAAGFAVRSSFVPINVCSLLREHIDYIHRLHTEDLLFGFGQVRMPDSFANTDGRYSHELGWQWLFSRRSLALEISDISREKLILEILKRRINYAAIFLKQDGVIAENELGVDVFWKSYLAGIYK